jgi:hypothetical protein
VDDLRSLRLSRSRANGSLVPVHVADRMRELPLDATGTTDPGRSSG